MRKELEELSLPNLLALLANSQRTMPVQIQPCRSKALALQLILMRMSLFTGRLEAPQRISHVREATAIAAQHEADMLVLPGYLLRQGRDDKDTLQHLADESGVSILGEAWKTFYFRPNHEPLGSFVQRFHQGTNATYDRLLRITDPYSVGSSPTAPTRKTGDLQGNLYDKVKPRPVEQVAYCNQKG